MKYFNMKELTRTNTGLANIPTKEQESNLIRLVEKVLDPLREMYGRPIYINSGFRSKDVNKKVGGATYSAHLRGCAVDITTKEKEHNAMLYYLMMFHVMKGEMEVTKVINEKDFLWLHIEYTEGLTPGCFLEIK